MWRSRCWPLCWSLAPIQDFFRGSPREPAVRTTSSITFAYNPVTRPINTRLLAESSRLEVEREEAASRSELADARADELRRSALRTLPAGAAAPATPGWGMRPADGPAPTFRAPPACRRLTCLLGLQEGQMAQVARGAAVASQPVTVAGPRFAAGLGEHTMPTSRVWRASARHSPMECRRSDTLA